MIRRSYPPNRDTNDRNTIMSIDVNGQNVLITGANRGIGKVLLETALAQGARRRSMRRFETLPR